MSRFPNIFPRRGSRAGLLPCAGRLAACLLAGLLLNSCGWASSAEDPSEGLILHGFATRNGGSRIHAAHERKWTPLHVAAYNGRLGLIPLLLSAGADPDAETVDGKTPLDLAEAVAENDALPGATRQLAASCAGLLREAMAARKR